MVDDETRRPSGPCLYYSIKLRLKSTVCYEGAPMTLYLRDTDLADRYGVHRTTVWRWASKGLLPKPFRLTDGCTRWKLPEIEVNDAALERQRRRNTAHR